MAWMREPDTPGGFKPSMACRPASSSATADMMIVLFSVVDENGDDQLNRALGEADL